MNEWMNKSFIYLKSGTFVNDKYLLHSCGVDVLTYVAIKQVSKSTVQSKPPHISIAHWE